MVGSRIRDTGFAACFFAEQSVSKALKGVLCGERDEHPQVHHIDTLLDECARVQPVPDDLDAAARTLDKYYTTTRYPDVLDYALPAASFSAQEADAALAIAQRVIAYARERLRQGASTNPQP